MKGRSTSLMEAVPTLSEAIEIALPHMRALAAPLAGPGLEPDNLVESFVESVLFGAVWFRPPFRPIDMADAFMDDLLAEHAATDISPEGDPLSTLSFENYAAFVRRSFWQGMG